MPFFVSIHTPTKGVTLNAKPGSEPEASFNPHTHEGCDVLPVSISNSRQEFQSTHPRRVWLDKIEDSFTDTQFQSTHPRRVWPLIVVGLLVSSEFQSTHPRRVWHILLCVYMQFVQLSFNPHTHEGCDLPCILLLAVACVSIHTPTKGVTFPRVVFYQYLVSFNPHTHEGCDSHDIGFKLSDIGFNPHTHEGCDHYWLLPHR